MRAVIGVGSNLGDRLATMQQAVRAVAKIAKVERTSAVYETLPVGGPPQPSYLNAALLVSWDGEAAALLEGLQSIEAQLGRVRTEHWGPRTIDLDLLWIHGLAIDEERLIVPHPRLLGRAFALSPLLDVAPDAVDPRTGAAYRGMIPARGLVKTDMKL